MRRKQHLKEKKTSTAEHQKPTEKNGRSNNKKAQQIEKSRPSREMLVKLIFFNSKKATTTRKTPPRKQCNLSFSRKFKTQSTKRRKKNQGEISE